MMPHSVSQSAARPGDAFSTEMTHVPRLIIAFDPRTGIMIYVASGRGYSFHMALLRERTIESADLLWLRRHALRLPHAEVAER